MLEHYGQEEKRKKEKVLLFFLIQLFILFLSFHSCVDRETSSHCDFGITENLGEKITLACKS